MNNLFRNLTGPHICQVNAGKWNNTWEKNEEVTLDYFLQSMSGLGLQNLGQTSWLF